MYCANVKFVVNLGYTKRGMKHLSSVLNHNFESFVLKLSTVMLHST